MSQLPPSFESTLATAYHDWPETLDLDIEKCPNGDGYTVDNLYEIKEKICQKYIGEVDEVLLVNIHESIFEVIRKSARFLKKIKINSLREEEIFLSLKERLNNIYFSSDLGWTTEDREKIYPYLSD